MKKSFQVIPVKNPSSPKRVCFLHAAFTGADDVGITLGVKGAHSVADALIYPSFKGVLCGGRAEYATVRLEEWHEGLAVRLSLRPASATFLSWWPQTLCPMSEAVRLGWELKEAAAGYKGGRHERYD
jgi:hypothetical protein